MNLNNVKLNLDTELVLNVGCPINKTNAPRTYNKLFELLDMNAIMLPCEIQKGDLTKFMDACHLMGIHYICPTMPHKSDFIPLLDDVDETSKIFNSVNAIRIDEKGSHGAGMDGKGAVGAIVNEGVDLKGAQVLMLGAGSISGVIGYELSRQGVEKIIIANRSKEKAQFVANIINNNTNTRAVIIEPDSKSLDEAALDSKLFLNLTPLGMSGYGKEHAYTGFLDHMPKDGAVFDCVINPPDTKVILQAKSLGLKTIPGMKMLVSQMDVIFDYLFGKKLNEGHKKACMEELCTYLGVPCP